MLNVIVDDGSVQAPVMNEFVPAALGLVTEGALPAALEVLEAELRDLLVESPVLITAGQVEAEESVQEVLREVSAQATELLALCLPDAPQLAMRLAPPWRGTSMLLVEAVDVPSGRQVPLSDLSAAQARWAALAVPAPLWWPRTPPSSFPCRARFRCTYAGRPRGPKCVR